MTKHLCQTRFPERIANRSLDLPRPRRHAMRTARIRRCIAEGIRSSRLFTRDFQFSSLRYSARFQISRRSDKATDHTSFGTCCSAAPITLDRLRASIGLFVFEELSELVYTSARSVH
jgi:hypothetical protein